MKNKKYMGIERSNFIINKNELWLKNGKSKS